MNIEEELLDKIDPSHWISQEVDVAYSHRFAKGDLSIRSVVDHNGRSQKVIVSRDTGLPIDEIRRRGLISDEHHQAAVYIISLHSVAFRNVGWSLMREQVQSMGMTDDKAVSPVFIYSRIMRALNPQQRHMVDRLCFQTVRENDYGWIRHCIKSVHNSFDELKKLIDSNLESAKTSDITRDVVSLKSALHQQ